MLQSILAGLILAIVTALVTSILTYHFTNKAKKVEAIIKFREEKYGELLVLLEGFVGVTASVETKRALFKEQHKSWLYCSDEVTKAVNHMIELVISSRGGSSPDRAEGHMAIGNIVLAMRKDLLGKTSLDVNDFQYIDVLDPHTKKKHNQ